VAVAVSRETKRIRGVNMEKNKKPNSKNIWMYAVLLFTSAFVILVLTAYSQMKLNKENNSISSTLKNAIEQQDTYKINLNQTLEENKAILAEMELIKETNTNISVENKKLRDDNAALKTANEKTALMYEKYIAAQAAYDNNDWIGAAKELYNGFDITLLSDASRVKCQQIIDTIGLTTAERAYINGYNLYVAGRFTEAADLFDLSTKITTKAYYSDDCYYLEAHCYMALKNNTKAAQLLDLMIRNYPDSNLINEAKADYATIK
jgi:TolA-binding protein